MRKESREFDSFNNDWDDSNVFANNKSKKSMK